MIFITKFMFLELANVRLLAGIVKESISFYYQFSIIIKNSSALSLVEKGILVQCHFQVAG